VSDAKHTPGPWRVSPYGDGFEVEQTDGKAVAQAFQTNPVRNADSHIERRANARLMSAAPELLDELRYLVEIAEAAMRAANRDGCEYDIGEMLEAPRAAILKATGEQA
jgi:hypothetical protein